MVEVEVEYDYEAEYCDELSIQVGDVITNVKQMSGGWWEGTLNGKHGLFPENFVKVKGDTKDDENGQDVQLRKGKQRCRVLFSYRPTHDDELELKLNEQLDFIGEVEDGWWKGRSADGSVGVFPSNFVELITASEDRVTNKNKKNETLDSNGTGNNRGLSDIMNVSKDSSEPKKQVNKNIAMDAPKLPPKPIKEQCTVLFPYTALNEDELTLVEGQVISIISKDVEDKGWWKGEVDGKIGVFPDNFVKMTTTTATPTSTTPQKAAPEATNKVKKPSIVRPGEAKENSPVKNLRRERKSSTGSNNSDKSESRTSGKSSPSESLKKPSQVANKINKLWQGSNNNKPSNPSKPSFKRPSFGKAAAAPPKPTTPTKTSKKQAETEKKDLEMADNGKLIHLTASRVKAPKRRPPSAAFLKDELNGNKSPEVECLKTQFNRSNSRSSLGEISNDSIKPSSNMTSSTIEMPRSVKTSEVKKPEWLQELSKKQAGRNSEIFLPSKEPENNPLNKTLEKAKSNQRPLSQPPPITAEKPSIPTKPFQIEKPVAGRISEPSKTAEKPCISRASEPTKPIAEKTAAGRISEPTKPVTGRISEPTKPVTSRISEPTKPVIGRISEPTKPAEKLVAGRISEPTEKPVAGRISEPTKPVEKQVTGRISEPTKPAEKPFIGRISEPLKSVEKPADKPVINKFSEQKSNPDVPVSTSDPKPVEKPVLKPVSKLEENPHDPPVEPSSDPVVHRLPESKLQRIRQPLNNQLNNNNIPSKDTNDNSQGELTTSTDESSQLRALEAMILEMKKAYDQQFLELRQELENETRLRQKLQSELDSMKRKPPFL